MSENEKFGIALMLTAIFGMQLLTIAFIAWRTT